MTTTTMTTTLWNTPVNLQINPETAPTSPQDIAEIDELLNYPTHDYYTCDDSGEQLHYMQFLPKDSETEIKGIVVFQHGIGGWSGRACQLTSTTTDDSSSEDNDNDNVSSYCGMAVLSRMLVNAGYALYTPDMVGHGFSEGSRFYIPNGGDWTINRNNLQSFTQYAAQKHSSDIPLFLMGESYGGCLALHVAHQFQTHPTLAPTNFAGMALLCPAIIGGALPPPPIVYLLKNVLAKVTPQWTPFFMPHPVNPDRIWKIPEVKECFTNERAQKRGLGLCGKPFCLGTAAGLLNALESVRDDVIPNLTVPFVVAHGDDDVSVPIEGTDYLMEQSKTEGKDKVLYRVVGGCHDLLSESSKVTTVRFLIDWMDRKTS